MKTDNRLLDIQEMLFRQMKRIDNEELTMEELQTEVSRSNSLSNNAMTFIKTVNVNIRVKELAEKYQADEKRINKELGL